MISYFEFLEVYIALKLHLVTIALQFFESTRTGMSKPVPAQVPVIHLGEAIQHEPIGASGILSNEI